METTKTVLAPGERITVIDALRGFSLIGICLIHSMQHFGAMGTMTSQAVFPWKGTMNEIFSWLIIIWFSGNSSLSSLACSV